MKKKVLCLMGIIVLLAYIAYFIPLSLSDIFNNNPNIDITLNTFEIENGQPNINTVTYDDITEEQKTAVFALLEKYTYHRTLFGTLFSGSSISDPGEHILTIYKYENDSCTDHIKFASSGTIIVNSKSYHMNDAEQFIQQVIEIVK